MLEYETFEDTTTNTLLDMADIFRACVAGVNGSTHVDSSRVALPRDSRLVISAGKEGLKVNFSHSVVTDCLLPWVLDEMEDMHTVADEIRFRLKNLPEPMLKMEFGPVGKRGLHAYMLGEMESEAKKCLDIQFGEPKPSLAGIMAFDRY